MTCHECGRILPVGTMAWASDWTVIDSEGTRRETRYTCDECSVARDGAPCCLDPGCGRSPCTFPARADNH